MEPTIALTAKHAIPSRCNSDDDYILSPTEKVQKIILIGSALTAILSLVPSLRFASSLALRSFSLISAGSVFANDCKTDTNWNIVMKASKIAAITLGIVAIIAASPLLLIPALSIDILFQSSQLISSACEKTPSGTKILSNVSLLIIDTLFLAGIAVGSWGLMTAAASVSIVSMICFACYAGLNARCRADIIDIVCYTILAVVGLAGAITISERSHYKYKYIIENSDTKKHLIVGNGTDWVADIMPEKTALIESTYDHLKGRDEWFSPISSSLVVTHPALEASKFPQLSFAGGLTLGTADEMGNIEKLETPRTFPRIVSAWEKLKSEVTSFF